MFSFNELQLDATAGIALFGERTVNRRGVRIVEPAYGLDAVKGFLTHVGMQDDTAMMHVLREAGLSGPGIDMFASMKTAVRASEEQGGGVYADVRVVGVADDPISNYAGSETQFGDERNIQDLVVDDRRHVYKLNAIFSDATVSDKLQISEKRVQVAKRLVITDPVVAARSLTEYIRSHGFPNSRVIAGDYAKSAARARTVIRQFAALIQYRDCMANARMSASKLYISFDGFQQGPSQWTVVGPIKYATECHAVYQLAIMHGPNHVMFLLGVETAMLGINIMDDETGEMYQGTVYGFSSLEGIQPAGSQFPPELTAEQKITLTNAASKIAPVYVENAVVGTAVAVSDRHIVLNEHTVDSVHGAGVQAQICDQPLVNTRSVSHDLCVFKCTAMTARWVLREPDVGERVVLCYSVGTGRPEYTEVLRVNGATGEHLVLSYSSILRRGASGAAVVALRDGALLGIFSTIRAKDVICSAFSSLAFRSVTDLESVYSDFPVTPGSEYNQTYDHMVRRGFLSFLEGINTASASLYATSSAGHRQTVGTVANWAGQWVTAVDPNVTQLSIQDGQLLTFRSIGEECHSVVKPPPILTQLPNVRIAQPGERVFAFVKTGDDVALTPMRSVIHCNSDVRRFRVEDFGDSEEPMIGALIVAERDAAVLGVFVSTETDAYGVVSVLCSSLVSASRPSSVIGVDLRGFDSSNLMREFELLYSDSAKLPLAVNFGKSLMECVYASFSNRPAVNQLWIRKLRVVWQENYDTLLLPLGWSRTDWQRFGDVTSIDVAYAYLAVSFMRDPVHFVVRVAGMLQDYGKEETTPVVSEFPFPASRSQNRSSSVESSNRLRELEEKVMLLSQRVETSN